MKISMSTEMEDMADAAGEAANEAYNEALGKGDSPSECFEAACIAASETMTEFGAPQEMVDMVINAASTGFNDALAAGMDPQQCFDAAGDSLEAEFEIDMTKFPEKTKSDDLD
tara:strand:+ start:329 stop:667 length:339 start_codon:yes stop_codon:yes gene_type:complete